jgi:hypothetical protein
MGILGYEPSPYETAGLCLALGLALALVSLVANMVWEAFKHCTGRFTSHGVRRCVACMEPAELGSPLCARHAAISSMVRRRSTGKAA